MVKIVINSQGGQIRIIEEHIQQQQEPCLKDREYCDLLHDVLVSYISMIIMKSCEGKNLDIDLLNSLSFLSQERKIFVKENVKINIKRCSPLDYQLDIIDNSLKLKVFLTYNKLTKKNKELLDDKISKKIESYKIDNLLGQVVATLVSDFEFSKIKLNKEQQGFFESIKILNQKQNINAVMEMHNMIIVNSLFTCLKLDSEIFSAATKGNIMYLNQLPKEKDHNIVICSDEGVEHKMRISKLYTSFKELLITYNNAIKTYIENKDYGHEAMISLSNNVDEIIIFIDETIKSIDDKINLGKFTAKEALSDITIKCDNVYYR